jgi:hypothetical protein
MTTATKSRPRKQVQRTLQFVRTGLVNQLWIKQGHKTDGYTVEDTSAYNNADLPTFRLIKTDGTVHDVLLDGPQSLCDCKGFERFGMCKDGRGCRHIAALTKLRQLKRF